jgi:hypothetical protein
MRSKQHTSVSRVCVASTLRTYLEAVFASVSASSDVAPRALDIHVGCLSELQCRDFESSKALQDLSGPGT